MFGYRHAFHAGCHADVLKHMMLVACLNAMMQKDKPLFYLDTHAGAGLYNLTDEISQKSGEYKEGIKRIWDAKDAPELVKQYLECMQSFQGNQTLEIYPGSPAIATTMLREKDRLCFNEWHPTDSELLKEYFGDDKRVRCIHGDGLLSLKSTLPPKERRGLIVIDPSYEVKEDYLTVPKALLKAYEKFETGIYFLWYPLVFREKVDQMLNSLTPHIQKYLIAELSPQEPAKNGKGMYGSGVLLINPPWTLETGLNDALPWLSRMLSQSPKSHYRLFSLG